MKKVELFTKPGLLPAMLVAAILLVLMAFAPAQQSGEEGWTLLSSEQGVNAYAMESNCGKSAVYIFRFENTSNQPVSFSYTLNAKTDPTFPPVTNETVLQGSQVATGSCDSMWELALPNSTNGRGDIKTRVEVTMKINK